MQSLPPLLDKQGPNRGFLYAGYLEKYVPELLYTGYLKKIARYSSGYWQRSDGGGGDLQDRGYLEQITSRDIHLHERGELLLISAT